MRVARILTGLKRRRLCRVTTCLMLGVLAFSGGGLVHVALAGDLQAAVARTRAAQRDYDRAEADINRARKALAVADRSVRRLERDIASLLERQATAPDKGGLFAASKADIAKRIQATTAELNNERLARSKAEADLAAAEARLPGLRQQLAQAEHAEKQLRQQLAGTKVDVRAKVEPAAAAPAPAETTERRSWLPGFARRSDEQAPAVEVKAEPPVAAVEAPTEPSERRSWLPTFTRKASDDTPEAQPAPQRIDEPKPVLEPRRHVRQPLVSEPAAWTEKEEHETPTLVGERKIETPEARDADVAEPGKKFTFDLPMISGDKHIVEKLPVWKEWAEYVTFNPVTAEEINEFHGKLTQALQQEGYVFAKVTFPTRIWAYGIFLAKVDCGPLGTIIVRGNRHYSARQIIRALARDDSERFNYARIHGDLFDINSRPDIMIDAKLKPVVQDGRRVINAELDVTDSIPLHAAIELSNTGTKRTDTWRIRTTVQHVNLSKRDDVLTFDWLTSPNLDDVNAFSGGYFLPFGDDYSLSLYGGYSVSDIEDVLPQLDVRGRGHYFGGQVTKTLFNTPKHRLQLTGGWIFQHTQTQHEIGGATWNDRKLDLSMPSVTVGYASRAFDKLGGRNFLSNTMLWNFAGSLGSSETSEFNEQGTAYADGNFMIDRFQLARLQRFFRGEDAPGKWTLFMKLDGQLASDTLIPAVRKSLGGANTVRGYREQEISGDQALVASLELRTPLFHNFIPGLKKSDEFLETNPEAWQRHRLQFIAFADYGHADLKNPRPGEQSNESMLSAGLGLRLGLTKYAQMRLDYGYPFEDTTEDTPSSGRAHLSLQLQF